ncbi:MAG: response regulator [Nannocystaceae bacterium]|nr:response regulator [Nannocystaceae bacterium]
MTNSTDDSGLEQSRSEIEVLRARAEQADATASELRRSEELTRRLIEAMPGGVVHVSAVGAIQTANAEALRILGLSYDELSNRYTTDFETQTVFEDGSPCPVEQYPVSRALATGEAQPAQTIGVRRTDGRTAWAIFTAVPIKEEDGSLQGAVVTFLDITDRKQLEDRLREAEKMQAIGRLAGGIAHDFNNLLTVVLANTAEVQSALSPQDPHAADLEQVLEATRAAARLTGQLLSFARQQVTTPSETALETLTCKVGDLLADAGGDTALLRVRNAPNLWRVFVDCDLLEQVITNLVINAQDAIAQDGVITIETENSSSEDGDEVVLRVRDDGVGIDAAALDHIFEPFFTTKGANESVGLGLATCYGIVTQAGGTITAQSQPGQGSTFEVRLPRASPTASPDTPAPGEVAKPQESTRVVLVVEDEPAVRLIVERILAREGYRVLAAEGGAAALSLVEKERHLDLVLADVMMPGMLGPEVVRRVRELFPNVPALYMSGYADRVLDERGVLESPAQLIHKPFEVTGLTARVRESMENGGP